MTLSVNSVDMLHTFKQWRINERLQWKFTMSAEILYIWSAILRAKEGTIIKKTVQRGDPRKCKGEKTCRGWLELPAVPRLQTSLAYARLHISSLEKQTYTQSQTEKPQWQSLACVLMYVCWSAEIMFKTRMISNAHGRFGTWSSFGESSSAVSKSTRAGGGLRLVEARYAGKY